MANVEGPRHYVQGKVVGRTDWTDREFSLCIEASIRPFKAGQFISLSLQSDDGEWLRRPYSLVTSPGQMPLEVLLIAVPDGDLSPRLAALEQGDTVWVSERPSGVMTLDDVATTARDLWMLSTGTAIGPFLAMLGTTQAQDRFDNLVLVHAVRTEAELVYRARIDELGRHYGRRLKYVPVVSRETAPNSLRGRIPELIESGALSEAARLEMDPARSFFFLCGNPGMLRDCSETLSRLGFRKHRRREPGHFSQEKYW